MGLVVVLTGCAASAPHPPTAALAHPESLPPSPPQALERVSTVAPFPRGLALVDGELYVLCRGRVRGAGGVSAAIEDQAGALYAIDPNVAESIDEPEVGPAVRHNGRLVARPTSPPFRLWDRSASPPERDRETDRPYCVLRYHAASDSFYLCAFSGIDKPVRPRASSFSKNLTDALLRYDRRTQKWYELERHDLEAGGAYPHHDVSVFPPPHGWLNGPDNCLLVGDWLYAVAKDNNRLVAYDVAPFVDDPNAAPPAGVPLLDEHVDVAGHGTMTLYGPSGLAERDGWLYIAYRTSSVIIRLPLDERGLPRTPIRAELVAQFEPYDPRTHRTADLTDLDFDAAGRLYVMSAKPAKVYRFTPNPQQVYDARNPATRPWLDLAGLTHNPKMKCENLLVVGERLFVTSGDGYDYQEGAWGTVYRARID